eukprot:snap_masked-scaffold_7-processed-gene-5.38-mRNA-1 protein AED:1.00 eAED:1.00 QI:0/-1/0/0/-1/1/1/0/65
MGIMEISKLGFKLVENADFRLYAIAANHCGINLSMHQLFGILSHNRLKLNKFKGVLTYLDANYIR